jgi:DNA-binding transcriptional LysR family regulator
MPLGVAADAIELRHLRGFLVIAEELDLGRGAQRLRMPEAALADLLRTLEDQVGVPLAVHASSAVSLTEAGRTFAEQCRRAVAGVELAVAEARRAAGLGSALRIGCVPGVPIQRLQAFLGALHERDPALEAEVAHLPGAEQLRRLRLGELDLGIVHDSGEHGGVRTQRLFAGERLAAFLPQAHPLAVRGTLGPSDVVDETLVVAPRRANPALHDRMLVLVARAGYRFRAVREAGGEHPRDVLFAAAAGLGIALGALSLRQVAGDVASTVTRRTLDPVAWMPDTVVAWPGDPPRRLGEVIARARDAAHALQGE